MRKLVLTGALALAGGIATASPGVAAQGGCQAFGQVVAESAQGNRPCGQVVREFVPQGSYVEKRKAKACGAGEQPE